MLPEGFFRGFASSSRGHKRLAAIPDKYLNHLVELYNNGKGKFEGIEMMSSEELSNKAKSVNIIGAGDSFGTIEGLTATSTDKSRTPVWVAIADGQENFALQHEIGHAVESFVRRVATEKGLPLEPINAIWNVIANHHSFSDYAQTSSREAFAEMFNSFYCSPESHGFIKKHFDKADYKYMQELFEPPVWEAPVDEAITAMILQNSDGSFDIKVSTPKSKSSVESCINNKECQTFTPTRSNSLRNFFILGKAEAAAIINLKASGKGDSLTRRLNLEAIANSD